MILQALYEYYERKSELGSPEAAPRGFQFQDLPFLIVLDRAGVFVGLEKTQKTQKASKDSKKFLVPIAPIRSGGAIRPGLLWDQLEYAIGANPRRRDDVELKFQSFKARIELELSEIVHPSLGALRTFLSNSPARNIEASLGESEWNAITKKNPFVSFRIEGEKQIAEEIFDLLPKPQDMNLADGTFCPVTGGRGNAPLTHSKIKGVWGAQSAGATLVSFNLDSAESYGKTQNQNAQMSPSAADSYTKGLNILLDPDSNNRLQLGEASSVFWAQKKDSQLEKHVKTFFANPPKQKDDPDKGVLDAKQALLSVLNGIPPSEVDSLFYILGLSPNAARISVRFWYQGTVGEFARHMKQHLDDLEIVSPKNDPVRMGLSYLLGSTVLDWKAENIPPNLSGNVMRSVLTNSPYPETLQQQCLRRIRAESNAGPTTWRIRAAILKACLNRKLRRSNPNNEKEITVSLDTINKDPGYRLGRLFAVLEKIQEDANPRLNATIRDRFYGAASSNPVAVFPQLLKLKNHHLAKLLNRGQAVNYEKRLAEIFDGIDPAMPPHLTMDEQAKFAIGYYHQRQALFVKNEPNQGDQK